MTLLTAYAYLPLVSFLQENLAVVTLPYETYLS